MQTPVKFDTKQIRIALAVVLALGVVLWAFISMRSYSYADKTLTFGVGSGSVLVTNPSLLSVPAQILGTGTRVFRVLSVTDGIGGSSTRQGTGSSSTQVYDFALAPGETEFRVTQGAGLNFNATADSSLQATINPLGESEARTTWIFALLVFAASLYYISHITQHSWIQRLRGQQTPTPEVTKVDDSTDAGGQGRAPRSYGDNVTH
jgi:hypothetical protein